MNNKYFKIVLFIIAVLYALKCAKHGHDFEVFVYAGKKIIEGHNIYKPPFVQGLQYYYSPLFALLLSPLSKLPIMASQLIWIGLSYFLLYRIWKLAMLYFDISVFTNKQINIWIILTSLFSLRFILVDIGYVQMTTFLLWATLESLQLIKKDRFVAGAALLAFAINIKLLPLAFLVYLIYRNKLKAALFTCVFYVLYLCLPALYLGWSVNAGLLADWFTIINPTHKEWIIEAENGPSSLVALIPVYITDTAGVLSFKRNFINLSLNQVTLILNFVRLFFIALTLLFLGTRPFKNIQSNVRQFWEMSYLFIVIPLLYPHQQQYAFLYITPVFIYLTWYFILHWEFIKRKLNYFTWPILFVVGINFTPIIGRDVISGYVCEILLYYRILTIAVIVLIPVLWICKPTEEIPQVIN